MCGICGYYSYRDPEPVSRQLLADMTFSIRHRGPDDEGFYSDEGLALGMRRLSIIDLEGGHQPMSNEDGSVWIVYNGEIYNFPELRTELQTRGYTFRTRSDTETVIHAYEEWGWEGFARLNGMFAFALWDRRTRELILARDPFGIKPLYYTDQNGHLIFGSEIRAILADPRIPRAIDLTALEQYLAFSFVPSPHTLFKNIKKLPPGYLLRITEDGLHLNRFYRPEIVSRKLDEAEWLDALCYEIESAVKRQMIADVPVGVMLSGGMDSATVAVLMKKYSGQAVHSFTVGFDEDFAQNELLEARRSAELIGTTHHEATISSQEFVEFLPKSISYLEEPIANPSSLPFHWICKLAREYVKVVLTGQGADEPFAGYGRHLGEYYGGWYRRIPTGFRKRVIVPLIDSLPRNEQFKRAVHSLDIPQPLARLTQIYSIFNTELRASLCRNEFKHLSRSNLEATVNEWWADVRNLDSLNQMTYVDARFSLADNLLMYGDKMSMAVSLEARVPFLDLELMSFVEAMPGRLKIRGQTQKYLLKKAVAKWLPTEIIRRKKIGFATPVDRWFGRELRGYITDKLLGPGSACRLYFDPSVVERLIVDHENKSQDYKRHLFSLLTFELWHEEFITSPQYSFSGA